MDVDEMRLADSAEQGPALFISIEKAAMPRRKTMGGHGGRAQSGGDKRARFWGLAGWACCLAGWLMLQLGGQARMTGVGSAVYPIRHTRVSSPIKGPDALPAAYSE